MEPRIEVHRAADRFVTETAWSQTRHQFSFGDHYDPANVGHGRLVVSNDDRVRAGSGYDPHPHRDAEIITWVLSGALVHADSRGHAGIVHRGLAQRMSAGSGIVHTERNDAYRVDPAGEPEPVHFVQMWVQPDEAGREPAYQQRALALDDLGRGWLPVASGLEPDAVVTLGSRGSTLWVTTLAPGDRRVLPVGAYAHLYVARGQVAVETAGLLAEGDSLRITGEAGLSMVGLGNAAEPLDAEVLVWTMNP